jgi:hypothetical protein
VTPVGKPDAGNQHVRFDERGRKTERTLQGSSVAPVLGSTNTCVSIVYFSRRLFCRFDLALSANSTSWRIASEREGLSGCCFAQVSIADLSAGERRIADTGSCPVAGRPRFFRTTGIDFLAIIVLRKSEPVRSANFSPALTQATEVPHGAG